MSTGTRIESDLLKPLGILDAVQQGAIAYYRRLRQSHDPILAVGAWCALLDGKALQRPQWDEVVGFCRYEAVRARAFSYFQANCESDRAALVANTSVPSRSELEQKAMLARLAFDHERTADIEGDLYLATGDIIHLEIASQQAEIDGGWRAALAWSVRAVAVAPLNPVTIQRLFMVLESSAQPDLIEEAATIFLRRNMYLQIAQIFLAAAAMARGDAATCLAKLKSLDDAKVTANFALKPYLGAIRALRAQAEEKLGHYERAFNAYLALNAADRAGDINPEDFYKGIVVRGRVSVPPLSPIVHREVVQMVGFPRSGTTLLENALDAHPLVETFEEISALNVAIDRIERVLLQKVPPELPETTFNDARSRYYREIDARQRKREAQVFVDKLPIRSSDAAFMSKLFPEWRFLFSIRHPYDVVLSCFKQRFLPNPAMENFRTIDAAARAYDYTMTEWFKYHSIDDPKVHYVKYDELVTDFDRVMRGTLSFLGVEWDEAVREFSKSAEKRAAVTPSYHKVRQGLSIGVQTQWKNYRFAFQSEATQPLRKWAEFFGYPTE